MTLMLLPPAAAAQRIDSPYRFVEHGQTLSFVVGHINTRGGVLELAPQSGISFGARYGIRLGGPLNAEFDLWVLPTSRTVRDTAQVGDEYVVVGEADATLVSTQVALRFNITGPRTFHGIQPYLLAGGGLVFDLRGDVPEDADLDPDARFRFGTSFAGQFAAGGEWFPSDRFSLRADVRNLLWKVSTPDAFRVGAANGALPANEWTRNLQFSLAVGWHF